VLKAEENEILTRVGPGTPMGELLRRYWTPACLSAEIPLPGSPPARVRLLGESLVAFRDTAGRVGLVQENCPHRGASLYFGRNEDALLRCVYHGWAFDTDGKCVDMPSEPAPFCEKVRMKSYPVHESGGIVWTYMGPRETMTPFRDFGTDELPRERWQASKLFTDCNWVQAMEGNIDTSHISHLHQWNGVDDIPDDGSDKPGYPSNAMSWKFWRHDRAPRLEVEDTWYGYRYAGIRTTRTATPTCASPPMSCLTARWSPACRGASARASSSPWTTSARRATASPTPRRRTSTATAAGTSSRWLPSPTARAPPGSGRAITVLTTTTRSTATSSAPPRSAASPTS